MNTARALFVAIGILPSANPVPGLSDWRRGGLAVAR
ncbi:hypothetical protein FHS01_003809 [Longimicrobium terrae]|uniref:Uncharacterized protein n=1 Tax=Longimicrobium terrae TaxID=1639882 RepID=A0A841H2F2_9BACT|nr:hypothetical protein [Longimicrobium terrae]MBB4637751.1 hypothetical protein [Longimicrobium terrae]MBB6072147.1 hypothetical protein [Longimicrobium terrae]MBB6072148.1 hypothetical protein [Longimicrobium terrae]